MIRRKIILLFVVVLLISECCNSSSLKKHDEGPFEVRVLTTYWQPLGGVTITGGIDWTTYRVETDSNGMAVLPGSAYGQGALIYKNNFFPRFIKSISPSSYKIAQTPKQLKLIGDITGWSIRFDSSTIITVEYGGGYHVYSYNDQGIYEMASAQIPSTIRDTQVHGDTLWFSTHDDGIYVYSLENPLNPQQLFHLDIPGYYGKLAIKDGIVVVGNRFDPNPLRIYSYDTSGAFQEIAQFGYYAVEDMAFIGNFLIVVSMTFYDGLPGIYDLKDPANPSFVYEGVEPNYRYGFLYNNYVILVPESFPDLTEGDAVYKLINLFDPARLLAIGFFPADSLLLKIINDTTAVGGYNSGSGAFSVLSGNITQGFRTVAITTDNPFIPSKLHQFGGSYPPYFIIGDQLWKLEER
jgi:hypothetical protein